MIKSEKLSYSPLSIHTHTCDGLSIPAVRQHQVLLKLTQLALAHILLLMGVPLFGFWVRVWVQVWGHGQGGGRGGQLGSPLTDIEIKGPWAIGAGAPQSYQAWLTDSRCTNLEGKRQRASHRAMQASD